TAIPAVAGSFFNAFNASSPRHLRQQHIFAIRATSRLPGRISLPCSPVAFLPESAASSTASTMLIGRFRERNSRMQTPGGKSRNKGDQVFLIFPSDRGRTPCLVDHCRAPTPRLPSPFSENLAAPSSRAVTEVRHAE